MAKIQMGIVVLCAIIVTAFIGGCGVRDAKYPVTGIDRMEMPELFPISLPVGTVVKQTACYDLGGGNADGSYKNAFVAYVDDNNEPVIFDEWGPGCLTRKQMNVWCDTIFAIYYKNADEARIKFYFDNEPAPRVDMTFAEFFGGKTEPFTEPLVFKDWQQREPMKNKDGTPGWNLGPATRFALNYYPMPFEKRLKITVTPTKDWSDRVLTWYQFTWLAYPTADGVKSWDKTQCGSDKVADQWTNLGKDPKPEQGNKIFTNNVSVAKGERAVIFEQKGKGSIAAIRLKLEPYNLETFYKTRILMYWDGMKEPSVDLPLGYLFGAGGKDFTYAADVMNKKLVNLLHGFDSKAHTFYSYWPMPFWKNARIEIINESGSDIAALDYQVVFKPASVFEYPYGQAGYFCTQRTVDADNGRGFFAKTFEVNNAAGHIAALNFYTQNYAMDGDEFTYLDGSRTPQIHGSGTEDDHNQGWGGSDYQKALWGGVLDGFRGAYRIYQTEPYIFYDSAKINYEYSHAGGTANSQSDVVFYYYKMPGGPRVMLTDEIDIGDELNEQRHDYKIVGQISESSLTSTYDGYEKKLDFDKLTDNCRAFNGYSEFTIKLDKKNDGVRLRKRLSRFENGTQTAKVYVDGREMTDRMWHIAFPSSSPLNQSFMDSDFTIPAKYTSGKSSVRVKIEYVDSIKGEINEFYYWVYCFKK